MSAGNDVWGTTEIHAGNRTAQDSLPPYTTINIGQTVQVCSAGAPLEYNKESNSRYLFLKGDGASHTLSAQGPAGTVPLLSGNMFTAGSASTSQSGVVPAAGRGDRGRRLQRVLRAIFLGNGGLCGACRPTGRAVLEHHVAVCGVHRPHRTEA